MTDPKSLLRAAEDELAKAEGAASHWRDAVTALRHVVEGWSVSTARNALGNGDAHRFANLSGTDAVEAVLRENGGPLPMKQIVERVQAGGWRNDALPNSVYSKLYTSLSRQPHRFKLTGKAVWGLRVAADEAQQAVSFGRR